MLSPDTRSILVVLALAAMLVRAVDDGDPALPANKPRIRFVYNTECSAYMDWQVFMFEASFKAIGQNAKLTRLIACDDPSEVR